MKFTPGKSGNPNGRPQGALSRRTQLSKLLEPHATEIIDKAVALAKEGEPNALRLCLERLIPRLKEETIQIDIAEINLADVQALLTLSTKIIQASAEGKLTLEQAQKFSSIIEAHRKMVELVNIEARLKELESTLKPRT